MTSADDTVEKIHRITNAALSAAVGSAALRVARAAVDDIGDLCDAVTDLSSDDAMRLKRAALNSTCRIAEKAFAEAVEIERERDLTNEEVNDLKYLRMLAALCAAEPTTMERAWAITTAAVAAVPDQKH